jgi:hypothetical protein
MHLKVLRHWLDAARRPSLQRFNGLQRSCVVGEDWVFCRLTKVWVIVMCDDESAKCNGTPLFDKKQCFRPLADIVRAQTAIKIIADKLWRTRVKKPADVAIWRALRKRKVA